MEWAPGSGDVLGLRYSKFEVLETCPIGGGDGFLDGTDLI